MKTAHPRFAGKGSTGKSGSASPAAPLALLWALALTACSEAESPGLERGLLVHERGQAQPGLTLFSPIESEKVYLVDLDGRVVHTWDTGYPFGGNASLVEGGLLLRGGRKEDNPRFHGGGIGGYLVKHAWDGSVVWRFELANEQRTLHHDVEELPNGNLLAICWDWHSPEEALAHGRDPEFVDAEGFWPDAVIEIKPTPPEGGEIVWEWRAFDHLVQDRDPAKPNYGKPAEHPGRIDINFDVALKASMTKEDLVELRELGQRMRQLGYIGGEDPDQPPATGGSENAERTQTDWLHDNSVAYHPGQDLIVLSSPRLGEIYVIDHSTTTEEARGSSGGRRGKGGDLLYRWGNPRIYGHGGREDQRLFFQHNPTWLPDAAGGSLRLLVFNNGLGRGAQAEYSTVEELTLPFDPERGFQARPDGTFGPDGPDWSFKLSGDLYAPFISGAQRLPNGNTLICSGVAGYILEVTPDQRIVWNYLNPFGGEVPLPEQAQPGADMPPKAIFRASRIPEGDPRLAEL